MTGKVERLHLLLPITISLANETSLSLEFVIDTGFTGALTLSEEVITHLQLPYLYSIPADLADDTTVEVPIYEVKIIWEDKPLAVAVLGMGRRPLLGTALLNGHRLQADFADEASVSITALETSE